MLKEDIEQLLKLDYLQAVNFLKNKYGICKYDYFCNEKCISKNKKASRSREGLFLHHIDENKYANLSKEQIAIKHPYEVQKSDRLVYCNFLEHLLLHVKIFEDYVDGKCEQCATTGVILFLLPDLNNFFCTDNFVNNFNHTYGEVIKDNFNEYILILKYLINLSKPNPYDNERKKLRRSCGLTKEIIDYLYLSKSKETFKKIY